MTTQVTEAGRSLQEKLIKNARAQERARAKVKALDAERAELLSHTPVSCTRNCHGHGCGESFEVRDLVYLQTHWYERPHGCTGGDTWHQGEGNFICPTCGHRNRLYARPEIEALKRHFKSVENEHNDR